MRPRIFVVAFAFIFVALSTVGSAADLILRLPPGVSPHAVAGRHGFVVVSTIPGQNIALVRSVRPLTQAEIDAILASDRGVLGLEPSQTLRAERVPGGAALQQSVAAILESHSKTLVNYYGASTWDAYLMQDPVTQLNLPVAHSIATGAGTIAIIDTGIDETHPALSNAVVPGYDFVHEQSGFGSEWTDAPGLQQSVAAILENYWTVTLQQSVAAILEGGAYPAPPLPEFFGHGTMVAGIVHLTAPTAKIMPLKAFTSDGYTTIYDICRAIYYATRHGANVINMSFVTTVPSKELYAAVAFARRKGVVTFAAVGNGGLSTDSFPVYPADYVATLGVGSTSATDHRSTFSNYGTDVTIAAPGEGLLTTYPGGMYSMAWGTSFAAGWPTGSTALLLERNSRLRPTDVDAALSAGAKKLAAVEGMGYGRLDVYYSLVAVPEK